MTDLDHTADVQFHVWGSSLEEAFAHIAPCFFNYVTDISTIQIDSSISVVFSVSGHDMHSLLFAYMDEILFRFCSDAYMCVKVDVVKLDREKYTLDVIT